MAKKKNPCKTCTRVNDPYNCGNKDCVDWKEWFLSTWNRMHKKYRQAAKQFTTTNTKEKEQ